MTKTADAIARALEQRQGKGFRTHLGASIIGRESVRHIWYVFRWAKRAHHSARILRLFDRGNREEEVLAGLLRRAGIHVLTRDPDTGEQFRISDFEGHFGGSMDAALYDAPDFPREWVVGEFKTHSEKSFKALRKEGVEKAKPEHYAQVQVYLRYTGLRAALYFAVNKNDDDLEVCPIIADPQVAEKYRERASYVIAAETPPPRINDSPGWYLCKFCDHATICHHGLAKDRNCRTCVDAVPWKAGAWYCRRFHTELNEDRQHTGCDFYQEIPE